MRRRRWPLWWLPWQQIGLVALAGVILAGAMVLPPMFGIDQVEIPLAIGFVLILVVVFLSYGRS